MKDEYMTGKLYKATFIIDTGVNYIRCMTFFVFKNIMSADSARESLKRIINAKLSSDESLEEIIEITEQTSIPIYEEKIFKE